MTDHYKDWEIRIIKELYVDYGPKFLSEKVLTHRSRASVRSRAYRMGMKSWMKDTPEDDVRRVVELLASTTLNHDEIGEKVGVTRDVVDNINIRWTHVDIVSEMLDIDDDTPIRPPDFRYEVDKQSKLMDALKGGGEDDD